MNLIDLMLLMLAFSVLVYVVIGLVRKEESRKSRESRYLPEEELEEMRAFIRHMLPRNKWKVRIRKFAKISKVC